MVIRVRAALIGLVLVLLALVIGAMPASAGRLAGGGPGASAFILEPSQPGPPTGLTATAVSSSEVDLSWTAPSSGSPTVSYDVYDGTSQDGESNTAVNSAPITGTTFAVTGLSASTKYYFLVLARDAGGFGTYSDEQSATTLDGIGPPAGLSAKAVSSSEVDLSWTAPSGSPPAGYDVYEGTSSGDESNNPVNSDPITGTTFSVTGLTGGTTYYFVVDAVDAANNLSGDSNETSATTSTPTPGGIGPPAGLSAKVVSSSEVDLSWTAPSGSPPAGYDVYEGTSSGGESNNPVNSDPITGTTFSVTGLTGGTTYYFVVDAVDAANNLSGDSNEASATTATLGQPGPPAASTGSSGTSAQPWLILVVLAVIGGAIAGARVLIRRRRSGSAPGPGPHAAPGPGPHATPAPTVQAVPHAGPPRVTSVQATGTDATRTVHFVPYPGASIITTEEAPRQ